jgi:poly-beta-1,6-N-acetyl-D-glucosamine synthase
VKALIILNSLIFVSSLFAVLLIFSFTPIIISILYLIKRGKTVKYSDRFPSISIIIIVHNAEGLIENKMHNTLSLNYPKDKYEMIIFSDGSTDETVKKAQAFSDSKINILVSLAHRGKNISINNAVHFSSGEILVFSDADALLDSDALIHLVKYFGDTTIGGVCGQRIILEKGKKLMDAQSKYIRFDSFIKKTENKIGSISSNDGKIYAIRRNLFMEVPPSVTDDLYISLSAVKQGYRFVFEPNAKAYVRVPSRDPLHEIQRRRRIVSTSLRGIFILKELLNPLKYRLFSINLMVNKVLRRFLPVFLMSLFLSNILLLYVHPFFKLFFIAQIIFYLSGFSYWAFFQYLNIKFITKVASLVFYFCVGSYGTLLGLIDFLRGREIIKWEPLKTD